jgi:hypothetical protein
MLLSQFAPPANLNDLADADRLEWSSLISSFIDSAMDENLGNRFFNPMKLAIADDAVSQSIDWKAFPRLIENDAASPEERWSRADATRDVQDEYCEWSVTRDNSGKITRVTFTCEGPEYWDFLADRNPDRVVDLYRTFVSPAVRREDLFPNGTYDRRNRWNDSTTGGAMHLVQDNNTLWAQIDIAVSASIVRLIGGSELIQPQELIVCGQYGNPERHSDPHIGAEVNALARQNSHITLANPIGLYIEGFLPNGWETPDESDPSDYWQIVRGTSDLAVRAVYEVPPEKKFSVGDIKINGVPIQYGAQIAEFIRIKLTGVACRKGTIKTPPLTTCKDGKSPTVVMGAAPKTGATSILEKLQSQRRSRK